MAVLYFNPSHDMALANNGPNFYPPASIRKMQEDLCMLPLWMSSPGDRITASSIAEARRWMESAELAPEGREVISLRSAYHGEKLCPWGWDMAMRNTFRKWIMSQEKPDLSMLPKEEAVSALRELSHRRLAAAMLNDIVPGSGFLSGWAIECHTMDELHDAVKRNSSLMLKAPWSCSGKGLWPYVEGRSDRLAMERWASRTIAQQKSLMAEPLHMRTADFAMEFSATATGIIYDGLSVFKTDGNGAYLGNIVATQKQLAGVLARQMDADEQELGSQLSIIRAKVQQWLTSRILGRYEGCLGVDMMAVRSQDRTCIVPCSEINLRCTMGHLALHMEGLAESGSVALMRISHFGQEGMAQDFLRQCRPARISQGRITDGLFPLTPVTARTRFIATLEL